jgi:PAS domain S-box-containing protein
MRTALSQIWRGLNEPHFENAPPEPAANRGLPAAKGYENYGAAVDAYARETGSHTLERLNASSIMLNQEGYPYTTEEAVHSHSLPPADDDRYRSMFEHAIEGIFQMSADGRLLRVNPALARIYGFDSCTALLEEWSAPGANFYVKRERRREFQRLLADNGVVSGFESEVYRRDESTIWISENAVPVRDESGRVICYEGFVVDISERRAASVELNKTRCDLQASQKELRAAQALATESERLRALGAMVNGIAHDFNNSLWMILGYSELLQQLCRTKPVPPEFTEYVDTIVTASLEAADTLTRLSDFQRPPELSSARAMLELNGIIEKAVSFTRPRWETETRGRGTPVEIKLDLGSVQQITGSAAELCELFTHLVLNAVDAMPQGGTITIETRMVGGRVHASVADTGVGMTPEVRRRCLEPFYTTKGGRCSGVGLAMVKGTVERHGGTLKVGAALGVGARFVISFPIGKASDLTPKPEPPKPRRSLRILAVDDHPAQTELLAHALGGDWHRVTTVNNGRDAITRFDSEQFDLVITDQAMPEMSGDQLAAAIKAREPSTPVIMLTGLGRISEDEEDISEFVDLLVAKPASLKDLQAAIAKVII